MGDNGIIRPHWEGTVSSGPWFISGTYNVLQIIAIVMDNASNNNTLMTSLERRCEQRGVLFSAQDARMRCMPHTIHLAAIKALIHLSVIVRCN